MDKTLWLTFLGHPVDYVDIYGRSSAWVRGSTIETQWAKWQFSTSIGLRENISQTV